LSGEPQTDERFDHEIVDRMGPEFYAQVFAPAVRDARAAGETYESCADAEGRADFGALQERLSVGRRRAGQVALAKPAVLLAFDVVRCGGADVTGCPLRERRTTLATLVAENIPRLQLIAQTHAVEEAEE
jgi:ATP-dependent DNA ligase